VTVLARSFGEELRALLRTYLFQWHTYRWGTTCKLTNLNSAMKILHKDCWVSLAHHLSSVFFQCRQTLRNCTEYWPYLLKCLSGQDRNNVYLSNMALVWICSLFLIVSHLWRWWNAARRGRFWTFWHLHGCGQMTQEAPLQVAIRSVCWVCPSQYHNLEHDPIKDPYRLMHPPLSLPSMTNSPVS
jgi:hypothetical protein